MTFLVLPVFIVQDERDEKQFHWFFTRKKKCLISSFNFSMVIWKCWCLTYQVVVRTNHIINLWFEIYWLAWKVSYILSFLEFLIGLVQKWMKSGIKFEARNCFKNNNILQRNLTLFVHFQIGVLLLRKEWTTHIYLFPPKRLTKFGKQIILGGKIKIVNQVTLFLQRNITYCSMCGSAKQ